MRQMLLAVFSALYLYSFAQITVTSATFPAPGDTFHIASDDMPQVSLQSVFTPPGGNQFWDLSALEKEQSDEIVYAAASQGANAGSFPGADLLVSGLASETYFNKTNTRLELMGFAGADPAGFGIQVKTRFSPALAERRAPMKFFDVYQETSDLSLPFSVKDLPDTIKNGIPGLQFIDSIRIRVNLQRLHVVDAWGKIKIPGGEFPVLREKRTEYNQRALDVHTFLGWTNVPTSSFAGGLADFFGIDTTVTYRFYNNLEKEEIAVVTADAALSSIASVSFKDIPLTTDIEDVDAPGAANIHAFPNPAIEWVRFDCTNLPEDDYTLKIFNIIGKVVWKDTYKLAGNKSVKIDLDKFKKGTYLYSLVNKKGTVIGTKRLVIVKP